MARKEFGIEAGLDPEIERLTNEAFGVFDLNDPHTGIDYLINT